MSPGPCLCRPWPVEPDCCPDWPGPDAPEADRARAERAVRIASERLRKLTAGRYGLCEEVIRPCQTSRRDFLFPWNGSWPIGSPYGAGLLDPYVDAGQMRNRACGHGDDCACGPVSRVALPGPADSIVEVRLDGVVVDPATYTLTPDGFLVRTAGGPWPDCQDMTRTDDEPGTFSVRYLRGIDPESDPDAIRAVSVLSCELYKNLCGRKCQLPGRVRTIQREGITYDILTEWPRQGTGLDSVDDWLGLVNPYKARTVPTITTPDLPTTHYYNGRDC